MKRALEILSEPKRGRGGNILLKDFGKAGPSGEPLAVYNGKYGPYIKLGKKNIKLPEDKRDEETIKSLELKDILEITEAALAK